MISHPVVFLYDTLQCNIIFVFLLLRLKDPGRLDMCALQVLLILLLSKSFYYCFYLIIIMSFMLSILVIAHNVIKDVIQFKLPLKEHVALDRSSWSLKSVCYNMHMGRKML